MFNITSKQDYDRELERLRNAAPKVPGRTYHSWGAMKAWMGPVDEYGRPYSEGTSKTYSTHSLQMQTDETQKPPMGNVSMTGQWWNTQITSGGTK